MAKLTYTEQLQHPLWQKRRLEILEKAKFSCTDCGSKDKMLHVHHCYYRRGMKAWEYPDHGLRCLCEDCHKNAGQRKLELDEFLGATHRWDEVYGYAVALYCSQDEERQVTLPHGPNDAIGVADFYGIKLFDVLDFLEYSGWIISHPFALLVIAKCGSTKAHLQQEAFRRFGDLAEKEKGS